MSRGASTGSMLPSLSNLMPGSSQEGPTQMETDQGYEPTHDKPPPEPPAPIRHLMTQRPGDDRLVKDRRRRYNELQAIFERRCSLVPEQLWPDMEQPP